MDHGSQSNLVVETRMAPEDCPWPAPNVKTANWSMTSTGWNLEEVFPVICILFIFGTHFHQPVDVMLQFSRSGRPRAILRPHILCSTFTVDTVRKKLLEISTVSRTTSNNTIGNCTGCALSIKKNNKFSGASLNFNPGF